MATGEADWKSDVDVLVLVEPGAEVSMATTLHRDPDIQALDGDIVQRMQGGLNVLVTEPENLIADYDTLADKIIAEGIRLHGIDLSVAIAHVDRSSHLPAVSLQDLVDSI